MPGENPPTFQLTSTAPQSITASPDFRALADEVIDRLDVSEATRLDYQAHITHFLDFLSDQAAGSLTASKLDTFRAFRRHLEARADLAVSTKNKYLVTARMLLRELHRMNVIPVDITAGIKGFRQTRRHKRLGLSGDEVREIMSAPLDERSRAVMALLACQGLRQIEVVRLDVADIELTHRRAMIRGKGRDDKEAIDLFSPTLEALSAYLLTTGLKDGPLFPGTGNRNRGGRLTTRHINRIVKEAFQVVGVEKHVHGLRHYFTTALLDKFHGDPFKVKKFTRHRSIETLEVYNDDRDRAADLPTAESAFADLVEGAV